MNGKIIGGIIGMFVTLFGIVLSLTIVMPMVSDITSDPNIADYTGLATILSASLTIIVLAGLGFSIWALWTGIQNKRVGGRSEGA